MAKRDTVAAIKAVNGAELDPEAYSQKELDQLLKLADSPEEFAALRKQFDDDGIRPDDNEPEYKDGDAVFLHGEEGATYRATFLGFTEVDGQPGARVSTDGGEHVVLLSQMSSDGTRPADSAQTSTSTPDQVQGDSTPPEATVAEDNSTRKVKVNYANEKVAQGAGFIHPTSKVLITGDRVVSVPDDEWTDTMIRDKTLTEVRK